MKVNWNEWTSDDIYIHPPNKQLEPKEYAEAKKWLLNNRGKWETNNQRFKFPIQTKKLLEKLRNGERPNFKQETHYFPTPYDVCDQMFNFCLPLGGFKILEPSAGQGAILDALKEWCEWGWEESEMHCIEMNPENKAILKEKGYNVVCEDFEEWSTDNKYELILANPPFKRDKEHVAKMADHLMPNAHLVVVLPSSFAEKNKKLVASLQERFEEVSFYPVPEKTFKASGTMVSTCIMYASYYKDVKKDCKEEELMLF